MAPYLGDAFVMLKAASLASPLQRSGLYGLRMQEIALSFCKHSLTLGLNLIGKKMNDEIQLTPLERMKLASKRNDEREKVRQEGKARKCEEKNAQKNLERELAGKKPRIKKKKKDPLAPWNRASGSAFSGKCNK